MVVVQMQKTSNYLALHFRPTSGKIGSIFARVVYSWAGATTDDDRPGRCSATTQRYCLFRWQIRFHILWTRKDGRSTWDKKLFFVAAVVVVLPGIDRLILFRQFSSQMFPIPSVTVCTAASDFVQTFSFFFCDPLPTIGRDSTANLKDGTKTDFLRT